MREKPNLLLILKVFDNGKGNGGKYKITAITVCFIRYWNSRGVVLSSIAFNKSF